jgi:hypothetical protein
MASISLLNKRMHRVNLSNKDVVSLKACLIIYHSEILSIGYDLVPGLAWGVTWKNINLMVMILLRLAETLTYLRVMDLLDSLRCLLHVRAS